MAPSPSYGASGSSFGATPSPISSYSPMTPGTSAYTPGTPGIGKLLTYSTSATNVGRIIELVGIAFGFRSGSVPSLCVILCFLLSGSRC